MKNCMQSAFSYAFSHTSPTSSCISQPILAINAYLHIFNAFGVTLHAFPHILRFRAHRLTFSFLSALFHMKHSFI